uniref:Elongator acetyltransferase complex subunit 6 n=1 Tax=Sparus aurata TaxID=8175 RepID=A0A671UXB0_SPAAU
MYTELNSILNTTPDSFTKGEFILVSDRQSDASFLVHHFLSLYLRAWWHHTNNAESLCVTCVSSGC